MSALADRPTTLLIAALGGEGGGVLSNWIVAAAEAEGFWVQTTSVPGVAQRTGATTYYIEVFASPTRDRDRIPVMALTPGPGNVDVLIASELLEAGRAMQNGFVTPDRTTLIASTHRIYAIAEKGAMADGRFDDAAIRRAAPDMAKAAMLHDYGKVAEKAGSVINAVLLGALAGSGALPVRREAFEDAIRAGGIAVESNLKGFAAGFDLATGSAAVEFDAPGDAAPTVDTGALRDFPADIRANIALGHARLVDYQDTDYAALYVERLSKVLDLDKAAGGERRGHKLTEETGRNLALWMSFEDIIRVADLKTRRDRYERVREEVRARPDEPVRVVEFLKPGVEEWCSILPGWLARPILGLAERTGTTRKFNVGMHIKTTTVTGFLQLWLLSRLKWWRPRTVRYAEEQAMIEHWLAEVMEAARLDYDYALEVADCARLVKGYGDTHHRGVGNFRKVAEALPRLAGRADAAGQLRAIKQAALADPEGDALDKALSTLNRPAAAGGLAAE